MARNGFVAADALGREIRTASPPRRVVSLVPSETESVVAVGGLERLVGRTDYCHEPPAVQEVPSVGGTKRFDVERVLALGPDLVLANKEENGERDVRALLERGVTVHVSFPVDLRGAAAYLRALAALLHVDPDGAPEVRVLEAAVAARCGARASRRALVPIWKDPWMSFDARTYGHEVLRAAGLENVCAARARRYPLAADLGEAGRAIEAGERDTRYPRLSPAEIAALDPDVVLLPDEPYAFTEPDADALRALCPRARVRRVSGKDLFWYGVRTAGALERLAAIAGER